MSSLRADARAGFSLLEALASLAILAALAAAVLPLTRDLLARWSDGPERADIADHWMRGLLRLSQEAGEALPVRADFDPAGGQFALGAKCLRFTRRSVLAETPGLRLVTYRVVDDGATHLLLRQSGQLAARPGAAREPQSQAVVLRGPWPMHFQIAGAEIRGSSALPGAMPPAIALVFEPDKQGSAPAPLVIPLAARSPMEEHAGKAAAPNTDVGNGC